MPFSVYKLTQDWNQSGVTWYRTGMTTTENWRTAGGTYNSTKLSTITPPANQANRWVNMNVTSAAKDFYANPSSNYGFLISFDRNVADQHDYRSSKYTGDISQRPKLTVHYTPQTAIQPKFVKLITPAKEYRVTVYSVQGKKTAFFKTEHIAFINESLPAGVSVVKINGQNIKFVKP